MLFFTAFGKWLFLLSTLIISIDPYLLLEEKNLSEFIHNLTTSDHTNLESPHFFRNIEIIETEKCEERIEEKSYHRTLQKSFTYVNTVHAFIKKFVCTSFVPHFFYRINLLNAKATISLSPSHSPPAL